MAFGSQFVSDVVADFGWLPFRTPGELDQTASIWDLQSMEQIAILRGSNDAVTSAVFSPDSKYVVTASSDGYVRIYIANIEDLVSYAKDLIVRNPPELTCEERVEFLKEKIVCPTFTSTP
jgi:WD40 repeat protein